ncbi:hypothetical protein [Escherichia phage EC147]|nr:hypothetical protein [Escherichia phage EC147]
MKEQRIAASTGKIDKRTINGNNGTRRGKDKKKRKRPTGYYVLKDEVRAGLKARLEILIEYYGSVSAMAKRLNVSQQTVNQWRVRGMISAAGAQKVHNDYKKYDCQGYRASFCRPDLRFDSNGKPLTKRCDKREMLRVVRMSDYEPGGFLYKPESTNC